MFDSIDIPCLACQKDNISLCVKKWGPSKELGKRATTDEEVALTSLLAEPYISEPSRPLPTAIDAVISEREVSMLEYIYTLDIRYPAATLFQILAPIVKRVAFTYGVSVDSRRIRSAILALAAAHMFHQGHLQSDDLLDDYCSGLCRSLAHKKHSLFGQEDVYISFFLTLAEVGRFNIYAVNGRPSNDVSRAQFQIGVHIFGTMAIMNKINSEASGGDLFQEMWDLIAQQSAHSASECVIEVAPLYRQHLITVENDQDSRTTHAFQASSKMTYRLVSICNIVVRLSDILLREVLEGRDVIDHAAIIELREYLNYVETFELLSSPPVGLYLSDTQFCVCQYLAGKIIFHIVTTPSLRTASLESFAWAEKLVSTTQNLIDGLFRQWGYVGKGHMSIVRALVGRAGLAIPPADCFQREVPGLVSCADSFTQIDIL